MQEDFLLATIVDDPAVGQPAVPLTYEVALDVVAFADEKIVAAVVVFVVVAAVVIEVAVIVGAVTVAVEVVYSVAAEVVVGEFAVWIVFVFAVVELEVDAVTVVGLVLKLFAEAKHFFR